MFTIELSQISLCELMMTHPNASENIPRTLEGPIVSTNASQSVPVWVERLAWLMDRSIPIGRHWTIGLDGIVGLFPGVGDVAGSFISALIVASAIQSRLPRAAIGRMVANVAVDALLGGIPLIGDLFDFAYKANSKNLEIYQEYFRGHDRTVSNWAFTLAVALGLLVLMAVPVVTVIYLFRRFLA